MHMQNTGTTANDSMKKNVYDLTGKKALVTGASKGIGKSIALSLARQGCDVIMVSRDLDRMNETAEEIRGLGRKAWVFSVDVSQAPEIELFFRDQSELLKDIDIFVNNAAITIFKQLMSTTVDDFMRLFSTNVLSALRFVQLSAGVMIENKRPGSIVIITSINALRALPSQAAYSSTKAMLESMMVSFANELSPFGIRVNSLLPGAIHTDMNIHFTPEVIDNLNKAIPLGRVGQASDIGDVVAFMVSDAARYMTGSSVVVDGGMVVKR